MKRGLQWKREHERRRKKRGWMSTGGIGEMEEGRKR